MSTAWRLLSRQVSSGTIGLLARPSRLHVTPAVLSAHTLPQCFPKVQSLSYTLLQELSPRLASLPTPRELWGSEYTGKTWSQQGTNIPPRTFLQHTQQRGEHSGRKETKVYVANTCTFSSRHLTSDTA